ncbi:hypothetical protein VTI74DRAFT_7094 [Chaetomium olivicolor]
MDPAGHAELEEKARLQVHLQLQEQAQQSPLASLSRSPASGSNTVPMSEDELHSSPVHSQPSPTYSQPSQPSPGHSQPALAHLQPSPAYPQHSIPRVPVGRSPTPPPYSGPSTPAQEPNPSPSSGSGPKPFPRYPGLPALDYRLYKPALFDLSSDRTTIKSSVPYLSTSTEALVALIRQQATIPPKPQIHIVGKRGGRTDFSIKINLMHLLIPDDSRQRMDYLRCVGPGEVAYRGGTKPAATPELEGEGTVEAWAAKFVADTASVKSFALERVVVNMDVHWLEGQIRALLVGLKYPGTVTVTFPVMHSKVVVQSPDVVNKFITSVTGFFAGKRKYEVVKAVWPFATMPRGAEADGRRCAVQSEETWWKEWREPIRYAIATKRNGWVTNEDKLEALMEGMPSTVPADVDWGPDYDY